MDEGTSGTLAKSSRWPTGCVLLLSMSYMVYGSDAFAQSETPATAPPAAAPTAASTDDAIVVTARRRNESLQDVPIAITALSGTALESRGITRAADIGTSVPGVFSAPGSNRGSNSPVFAIRGQLNRDPGLTNDPSVGLYFAEVPWTRPQGSNSAFFDLQSVQVLKGPQGTLFGRNTTAGAILLTPNAPTDQLEGYFRIGGGTYDYLLAETVLNVPLGSGAALRLGGQFERRDGYLTNVLSGQRLNDLNDASLRASLRLNPSDNVTTTFIGTYYRSDTNGDGSRLIGISPAAPSAGVAGFYARLPGVLAQTNALGRYEFLSSFAPSVAAMNVLGVPQTLLTDQFARVETWGIQNTLEINLGESSLLGDITIRNIAGYRHESDASTFETSAVPFLSSQLFVNQKVEQVSEELQLRGKRGALDYLIGAFYFRESGHGFQNQYTIVPISTLLDYGVRNTAYSAYAHANVDLSGAILNGLGATAGVRFTRDERYLLNANRRQTTPGQVSNPIYNCLVVTAPSNDGSLCGLASRVSSTKPTWELGVNYRPIPGSMIYATVSQGYRAGGFNYGAQAIVATAPYMPEVARNYEFGWKNDFRIAGAPARANFAIYYTDYRDIQRTVNFALPSGIGNLTVNAARAHIFGAEAELNVRPFRGLELGLAYTYLRPRYDSFIDQFRDPVSGIIYPVDVSDSEFILVSRHSVAADLRYTLPMDTSAGEVSVLATYYYRTGFYTTSDINSPNCKVPGDPNPAAIYVNCYNSLGRLPGYGLLNLRIEWRNVLGQSFDLAAFVNNVTNKYYYPNALNAMSVIGTNSAQIGAPRMAGVSATFRFGER